MRPFARLQCVCFLHKLQIKTVQHRADRNAEEHAHDAEGLAANRDRHQNEQPRKTDGFADNLWVNQIALYLLQNQQKDDKPYCLDRICQQNQKCAKTAAKPCAKDWHQRGNRNKR